jgi:hypothetical protein
VDLRERGCCFAHDRRAVSQRRFQVVVVVLPIASSDPGNSGSADTQIRILEKPEKQFDIVACADLRESFERDSPGATVAVGETLAIHRCEVSSSALQSRQLVACQLPSAARIVEDGALEPVERGWDVMFQRRRERETPNPFEAVNPCVERRERHHASELSRP